MYCDCGKNSACAGGGTIGCGNGLVVMDPTDHGALKLNGPDVEVCRLLIVVANGGFCCTRWPVKKLGWSYSNCAPPRITVLPSPAGSRDTPKFGENCHGELSVNARGTPLSPWNRIPAGALG